MEWYYSEDKKRIELGGEPSQKLRITGHRISGILNLDPYTTPFKCWAEITKLVKAPFEESKYTIFGKKVEPKLIEYVGKKFPNVKSIEDYYGNIFKEYEYNNFKDISDRFGGVIDAVSTKNDGKTIAMICECKTSSHSEQWENGNVPITYQLQGALYSYLMGLDRVLFVCTFPNDIDYANPDLYEVNDTNTIFVVKKLNEMFFEIDNEYLGIKDVMQKASDWWDIHIKTGISPEFNEVKDKEYLTIIRASKPTNDNDLITVCSEAIKLAKEIKELEISSGIKTKNDELKVLEKCIKEKMIESDITNCDKYTLKKSIRQKFNEEKMAKEKPIEYNKYLEDIISYTLSKSLKED